MAERHAQENKEVNVRHRQEIQKLKKKRQPFHTRERERARVVDAMQRERFGIPLHVPESRSLHFFESETEQEEFDKEMDKYFQWFLITDRISTFAGTRWEELPIGPMQRPGKFSERESDRKDLTFARMYHHLRWGFPFNQDKETRKGVAYVHTPVNHPVRKG
ncbi:hypothetical protein B484DRAFT_471238, partial [Ochromonadaceae sp. CCMP2298]